MEFSIEKSKLIELLSIAKPALPNKATQEVLKNFNLVVTEDGNVVVRVVNQSFGFEVSASLIGQAEVKEIGEVNLPPMFYDLLAVKEEGQLRIKLSGTKLDIIQGKSKNSITIVAGDFPPQQYVDGYEEYDPGLLTRYFSKLSRSLSDLADRPVLQAYFMNPHQNYMIASDSFRISLFNNVQFPGNIAKPHGNSINAISKALSGLGEKSKFEAVFGPWSSFRGYQYKDDLVYLTWTFSFVSLQPDYPTKPYELMTEGLEKEAPKVKIATAGLTKVLTICQLYAQTAYSQSKPAQVELTFESNSVHFEMDIKGIGHVDEWVEYVEPVPFEEPVTVSLDPKMLLDEIAAIDVVIFKLFGSGKAIILLDPDTPNWAYLQAPMKKRETDASS